jgi:hypothetical protein
MSASGRRFQVAVGWLLAGKRLIASRFRTPSTKTSEASVKVSS